MIYYAFGQVVPWEYIQELINDGIKESEITTEFLETELHYQKQDEL